MKCIINGMNGKIWGTNGKKKGIEILKMEVLYLTSINVHTNKLRSVLSLLLIFLFFSLYGQNDSLQIKNELKTNFNKAYYADRDGKVDSALFYIDIALTQAKKLDDINLLFTCLVSKVAYLQRKNDHQQIKMVFHEMDRYLDQVNEENKAHYFVNYGSYLFDTNEFIKADSIATLGQKHIQTKQKSYYNTIFTCIQLRGHSALKQGSYKKALKIFRSLEDSLSLETFELPNKERYYSNLYNDLGTLSLQIDNPSMADNYFRKSMSYAPNPFYLSRATSSLATSLYNQNKVTDALALIDSTNIETMTLNTQLILLKTKALINLKLDRIKEFKITYASLKNLYSKNEFKFVENDINLLEGIYNYYIGNYSESLNILNKTILDIQKSGKKDFHILSRAYKYVVLNKFNIGKLNDRDITNFIMTIDSINSSSLNQEIREIEIKYQSSLKQAENEKLLQQTALQTAQLKTQRAYLLGGGGIAALLALLASLFYRQRKKQEAYNQDLQAKNQKIDLLKREAIHRTNNHLNLATNLIAMQKQMATEVGAKEMMADSESKLRAIAAANKRLSDDAQDPNDMRDIVEEILFNNTALHTGSPVTLDIEIKPVTLDKSYMSYLALIINELSTNSIKHAFRGIEQPKISVKIEEQDADIRLTYSDNGNFTGHAIANQGSSLINGLVDQMDGSLSIAQSNGYQCTISIPELSKPLIATA